MRLLLLVVVGTMLLLLLLLGGARLSLCLLLILSWMHLMWQGMRRRNSRNTRWQLLQLRCVLASVGGLLLSVSTDGLHAYTCMLTSSHPTRIAKQ